MAVSAVAVVLLRCNPVQPTGTELKFVERPPNRTLDLDSARHLACTSALLCLQAHVFGPPGSHTRVVGICSQSLLPILSHSVIVIHADNPCDSEKLIISSHRFHL
eukprot:3654877-Amphidinium_carterae.1